MFRTFAFALILFVASACRATQPGDCNLNDGQCNPLWAALLYTVDICLTPDFQNFLGGPGGISNQVADITVTSDGGYILAGFAAEDLNRDSLNSRPGGTDDLFLWKVQADGQTEWFQYVGGTGQERAALHPPRVIEVPDGTGYILTGHSEVSWGNPINSHGGGGSWLIARYDTNGNLVWHTFYDSGNGNERSGVGGLAGAPGGFYVLGVARGNLVGQTGAQIYPFVGTDRDSVIAYFDYDGTMQWHGFIGGTNNEEARGLARGQDGALYALVAAEGALDAANFPNERNAYTGMDDPLVVKLDSNGSYQWHRFDGNPLDDDTVRDILIDSQNRIYVAGDSSYEFGSNILNPHTGPGGFGDGYIYQLTAEGAQEWITFQGSVTATDQFYNMILDGSDNLIVTGSAGAEYGEPLQAYDTSLTAQTALLKLNASGTRLWNTFLITEALSIGVRLADSFACDESFLLSGVAGGAVGTPLEAYGGGAFDTYLATMTTDGGFSVDEEE